MIEVKNLSKHYGNKTALNDISFSVDNGEILGFLGPNGAGKSTTMNIITGYLSSSDGSISIDGYDILKEPKKAKKQIGYLPEQPPLYQDMTVDEYLNFMFDLKKLPLNKQQHLEEICGLVKIEDVRPRLIKHLSKGYKQRVGLAQALLGYPKVIILDEPTVGLDPQQIIEIRSLIKSLKDKHTVILSSHILSEIQAVCTRVLVINEGKIIADDTPLNLSNTIGNQNKFIAKIKGDVKEISQTLTNIKEVKDVHYKGEKEHQTHEFEIEALKGNDIRPILFKSLSTDSIQILELISSKMNLEDIFLKLMDQESENTEVSNNNTAKTENTEISQENVFKSHKDSDNKDLNSLNDADDSEVNVESDVTNSAKNGGANE